MQVVSKDAGGPSMWETSLQLTYDDYALSDVRQKIIETLSNNVKESLMPRKEIGCFELEDTLDQCSSKKWHVERMLRLTASKCKSVNSFGEKILGGTGNIVTGSMFRYISEKLWFQKNIQTKDMKYGISEEANARKAYMDASGNKVIQTGLWVNSSHPFLGASPDGLIITCPNDIVAGVLEIKCLKIMKCIPVTELIKKIEANEIPRKILSQQCFELRDGKLILKECHAYFFQVQLQMFATGLPFCDFVLHTPHGPPSIQRITQNIHFQRALVDNMTAFWEKVFIPEYFEMRVPRRLMPFVLKPFL